VRVQIDGILVVVGTHSSITGGTSHRVARILQHDRFHHPTMANEYIEIVRLYQNFIKKSLTVSL
jgi:hypothetical protein